MGEKGPLLWVKTQKRLQDKKKGSILGQKNRILAKKSQLFRALSKYD
jgi:hypothetical protein